MTKSISIIAKKGGDFKLCPAGSHVARCIQMVDLGTTKNNFGTMSHKVRVTFELPNELEVFNEDKGEQPFTASNEFTLSMNSKAALRKFVQGWIARTLTEAQAESVDVAKFLSKPGMITIVHNKSESNGNTYANINSISPLPKGTTCPPKLNEIVAFSLYEVIDGELVAKKSLTEDDLTIFNNFPEYLQNKIKDSEEFKAMLGSGALAGGNTNQSPEPIGEGTLPGENDGDLPDFLMD